jgi:hypothetical protein
LESLNLILEIKVSLVKEVHTDVTILTTRGITGSGRVNGNGVERTEVTLDTSNFLFEDLVVESGLEFSLTLRGCCDFRSGLTTTQDDEIFEGCDGGGVEGGIGNIGLQDLEGVDIDDLKNNVSPFPS